MSIGVSFESNGKAHQPLSFRAQRAMQVTGVYIRHQAPASTWPKLGYTRLGTEARRSAPISPPVRISHSTEYIFLSMNAGEWFMECTSNKCKRVTRGSELVFKRPVFNEERNAYSSACTRGAHTLRFA